MKIKTAIIFGLAATLTQGATTVSLQTFFARDFGLPLIEDNTGVLIPTSELTFEAGSFFDDAGVYDPTAITTIRGLDALTDDAQVADLFTSSGSAFGASRAGLFNGGSSDNDDGGALGAADVPVFILITRTRNGEDDQVILIDSGEIFPDQVGGEAVLAVELNDTNPPVAFGGIVQPVQDDSALPGSLQGFYTQGLTFDGVPEPSTSLLAGLAGLALAARRRRS